MKKIMGFCTASIMAASLIPVSVSADTLGSGFIVNGIESAQTMKCSEDGSAVEWHEGGFAGSNGCASVTTSADAGWASGVRFAAGETVKTNTTYTASFMIKSNSDQVTYAVGNKINAVFWGEDTKTPSFTIVKDCGDGWYLAETEMSYDISGKDYITINDGVTVRVGGKGIEWNCYIDDFRMIPKEETQDFESKTQEIEYSGKASCYDGGYVYVIKDEYTVQKLRAGETTPLAEYKIDTETDQISKFASKVDGTRGKIISADNGIVCVQMGTFPYTENDVTNANTTQNAVTYIDFNEETPTAELRLLAPGWGATINETYSNGYLFVSWAGQGVRVYDRNGNMLLSKDIPEGRGSEDFNSIDILWNEDRTQGTMVLNRQGSDWSGWKPYMYYTTVSVENGNVTIDDFTRVDMTDLQTGGYCTTGAVIKNGKLYVSKKMNGAGVYVFDITGEKPVYERKVATLDSMTNVEKVLPFGDCLAVYTSGAVYFETDITAAAYLYIINPQDNDKVVYKKALSNRPYMADVDSATGRIYAQLGTTGYTYTDFFNPIGSNVKASIDSYAVITKNLDVTIKDADETGKYFCELLVSDDNNNFAAYKTAEVSSNNVSFNIDKKLDGKYIAVSVTGMANNYQRTTVKTDYKAFSYKISLPDTWDESGMLPNVTVSSDDVGECDKTVTAAIAYYGKYDENLDMLLDVKLYKYNTAEAKFDTDEKLSVPQGATAVKAFLFENANNIQPMCENAELNK